MSIEGRIREIIQQEVSQIVGNMMMKQTATSYVSIGEVHSRVSPISLARIFHEEYERMAPGFGHETRTDTKEFDPESANGRLMIAVCGNVLRYLTTGDTKG